MLSPLEQGWIGLILIGATNSFGREVYMGDVFGGMCAPPTLMKEMPGS